MRGLHVCTIVACMHACMHKDSAMLLSSRENPRTQTCAVFKRMAHASRRLRGLRPYRQPIPRQRRQLRGALPGAAAQRVPSGAGLPWHERVSTSEIMYCHVQPTYGQRWQRGDDE